MKNSNKWENEIRDKMSEFEMKEPEGLWREIESRMPTGRNTPRVSIKTWLIAASVAAVVSAITILSLQNHETIRLQEQLSLSESASKNDSPAIASIAEKTMPREKAFSRNYKTNPIDSPQIPNTVTEPAEPIDSAYHDKAETQEQKNTTYPKKEASLQTKKTHATSTVIPKFRKNIRKKSVGIGLFASGIIDSQSSGVHKINRYTPLKSLLFNDEYLESAISPQALPTNSFNISDVNMRHDQPLRFGISVCYNITPRIGIESGITYSLLNSDFKDNGNDAYITGKQKLHYIGIPLNMRFRLAKWKSFSVYASAGILGEKLIAGKLWGDIRGHNGNDTRKNITLHEGQLQWSANASTGLQFDMTDNVGLYVEPGISYFFNNGSNIRNIYKDRQLNLNINMGLRISLGN